MKNQEEKEEGESKMSEDTAAVKPGEDVAVSKTIFIHGDSPSAANKRASKRPSIIQPAESYLAGPTRLYRNYFDVEGGTFPDLFSRDVAKSDDRESVVKDIASSRGARIYANLLVAAMQQKQKDYYDNEAKRLLNEIAAKKFAKEKEEEKK